MCDSKFTILPVQPEDIPEIAQLSDAAFEGDRQTQLKALGKTPFSMSQHIHESMPGHLRNPRCFVLKAVDSNTQEVMGYCNWAFRGVALEKLPVVKGRTPPESLPPLEEQAPNNQPEKKDEYVQKLEDYTGRDFARWMDKTMPEGVRCVYIVGLSVSPKYQGRGVGSALLRFGIDFCDKNADSGVFAWVHSSEPAWPMYAKHGFQVDRLLDVDLDQYAPIPPPGEGDGAKWGHYIFRYMKYVPKKDKEGA